MKKIFLTHKFDSENEKKSSEEIPESVNPFPHEINITDGGEFLDDGIRMKDQPFGETTVNEKE